MLILSKTSGDDRDIGVDPYDQKRRFILFDERNRGGIEKEAADDRLVDISVGTGEFAMAIVPESVSVSATLSDSVADLRQRQDGGNLVNPRCLDRPVIDKNYHENEKFGT